MLQVTAGKGGAQKKQIPDVRPLLAGRKVTFDGGVRLSHTVTALLAQHNASDAEPASPSQPLDGELATSAEPVSSDGCQAGGGVMQLLLAGTGVTEKGLEALFRPGSTCRTTLTTLDVSRCPSVTLAALSSIPPHSALRKVAANSCIGVRRLALAVPEDCPLESLALAACPHLVSVDIVAAALQQLTVPGCKMLRDVALTAPALRHLCAPQCSSLTTVSLRGSAPAAQLRSLNLNGCTQVPSSAVHDMLAGASQLQLVNVTACKQLGALVVPGAKP